MIDINKTYQTRCGYPVRLYAKDGGGEYPVHGAYFSQGKWIVFCWSIMGEAYIGRTSELDLIEVKPRIQREVWVNVYEDGIGGTYQEKNQADKRACPGRIACVKITIDCEHGEGLE